MVMRGKMFFRSWTASLFLCFMLLYSGGAVSANTDDYVKHTKNYSIKEAYDFFGKERTPFDAKKSNLPAKDVKYLRHLFFVTDLAFRARVNMMQYFFSGTYKDHIDDYNEEVDNIIGSFSLINAPSVEMGEVEKMLIRAIRDQQDFFKEWAALNNSQYALWQTTYKDHLLVKASHIKLKRAYDMLINNYPNESEYNQKAFHDHLSALDFFKLDSRI